MVFQNKEYFILLIIIPVLVLVYIFSFILREKSLSKFGDINIVRTLIKDRSPIMIYIKSGFILLAIFILIMSAARPKWNTKSNYKTLSGIDIVFMLDLSISMLTEDIKPNRLSRAKYEIDRIIDKMVGNRIGFIYFAGSSYIAAPLTLDYSTLKTILNGAHPSLMGRQGTRIGDAITLSTRMFNQQEKKYKSLIVLTDGEDHDSSIEEAKKIAKEHGITIYTVGIGNTSGEIIPIKDRSGNVSGYKKDNENNVVVSRLNEDFLKSLASSGGGNYYMLNRGLDKLYDDIIAMEKKEFKGENLDRYEDKFQIFLVIALIFLLLDMFFTEKRKIYIDWSKRV